MLEVEEQLKLVRASAYSYQSHASQNINQILIQTFTGSVSDIHLLVLKQLFYFDVEVQTDTLSC